MVNLVHAYEPRGQLKHVVSERNDDELGVLGALLDVIRHDRDLLQEGLVSGYKGKVMSFNHRAVTQLPSIMERAKRTGSRAIKGVLTFLKSRAASISSMTYRGVGL